MIEEDELDLLSNSGLTELTSITPEEVNKWKIFKDKLDKLLKEGESPQKNSLIEYNFSVKDHINTFDQVELSLINKNTYKNFDDKKNCLSYGELKSLSFYNENIVGLTDTLNKVKNYLRNSNNIECNYYSVTDIMEYKNPTANTFNQQTLKLIESLPSSFNVQFSFNKNVDDTDLYKYIYKEINKKCEENSKIPNVHLLVSKFINMIEEGKLYSSESNQESMFKSLMLLVKMSRELNKESYALEYSPEEINKSLQAIIEFFERKDKLSNEQLSKIHIVKELLSIMLFPQILNQCDRNLCGVDIFLRELAEKSPLRFILLGINLAENGNSNIPFFVACPPNMHNETSIILVMMASIRHSSNLPFIGYHPNSSIEYFRGATLPRDLFVWFKKSGFEVVLDGIKIFDENYHEISIMHRFFVGGIYSEKHVDISKEETIDRLSLAITNKKFGIDGLFSTAFTELARAMINIHDKKMEEKQMLLGAQYGHFMKIIDFEYLDNTTINISLNTFGKTFTLKNLPKHIFNQHCFGIFITKFKNPLQLDDQYEESHQESGCFPFFGSAARK